MIHHIFKIIWNERRANGWILLEYILVFCILWFCSEYLYHIGRSYREPLGFNIENTYRITMSAKNPEDVNQLTEEEKYELAQVFMQRTLQYPGVEHIGLSLYGLPYYGWNSNTGVNFNNDSLNMVHPRLRRVSKGYFDVFGLKLQKDIPFDWSMDIIDREAHPVIIAPDRNGNFGPIPIEEVKNIKYAHTSNTPVEVIGVTSKLKNEFFSPYETSLF
ncbi:MAG: hypothetical protein LUD74_03535 [Tannerellaceae bacterium]|nr:hypothetical protein [Tannerellaceae bacterium]